MMRARWIQLAGAWRAAASFRSRRSSAGSVGGRACRSAGMASPRCRYGHDHGTPSLTLIPDLRNAALSRGTARSSRSEARASRRPADRPGATKALASLSPRSDVGGAALPNCLAAVAPLVGLRGKETTWTESLRPPFLTKWCETVRYDAVQAVTVKRSADDGWPR